MLLLVLPIMLFALFARACCWLIINLAFTVTHPPLQKCSSSVNSFSPFIQLHRTTLCPKHRALEFSLLKFLRFALARFPCQSLPELKFCHFLWKWFLLIKPHVQSWGCPVPTSRWRCWTIRAPELAPGVLCPPPVTSQTLSTTQVHHYSQPSSHPTVPFHCSGIYRS